ncbi:MAG: hypothetical protein U5K43_10215 [Halofilum sp. (in: g-proteobacteria)]|nr:hypothetical protein [Halofilum sp. (in: g-proteobacteria)]
MRRERRDYYQYWTRERLLQMTEDEFHEYIARLWAMLIWGNKRYVTDKLVEDNGLDELRKGLADLVWGADPVAERWDRFRQSIKGIGPAMMSEILSHVRPGFLHAVEPPRSCGAPVPGRRAAARYDYQMTGDRYAELSEVVGEVARSSGSRVRGRRSADSGLLHLGGAQPGAPLSLATQSSGAKGAPEEVAKVDQKTSEFIHDEIRDKLVDIGTFLGLKGRAEVKVADGSKVDAVWEQTIGNMGRVIYVFEVQTKGSIDSLVL